jgi:hypothetical protein
MEVTTILAPYPVDEQLHHLDVPADHTITASFPPRETRERRRHPAPGDDLRDHLRRLLP